MLNKTFNEQLAPFDQAIDHINGELKEQDNHFKELRIEISKKLDQKTANKIWGEFQRFAEYSDLKDLYSKCVPPLAKFE